MGKAVPEQHPAVVLRSHYNHLRALLIAALIAVLGLAGAVVIVANDDDTVVSTSTPAIESGTPDTAPRYDGGPNEGSADITPGVNLPARPNQAQAFPGTAQQAEASVSRHDIRMDLRRLRAGGVTSQGSADVTTAKPGVMPQTGSPRYDGGPNEGSADVTSKSGGEASVMPQTDGFRYQP